MSLPILSLTVGEVVEGYGEVGGVGGWVVLGQGSVEVGGFLGGLEGLVSLPILDLNSGEVVERSCEAGCVGGWVVLDQRPVEVGGFLGSLTSLHVSSRFGQAYAD